VWQSFEKIGAETAEKECLEKKKDSTQNIMVVLCYTEGDHNNRFTGLGFEMGFSSDCRSELQVMYTRE